MESKKQQWQPDNHDNSDNDDNYDNPVTMTTRTHNLLLVEDDLNFGAVLKSYLELNDFIVDWVDDGKDAMPKFQSKVYDLVLLDVMLPNIDGFSIANEIKNKGSQVPFIFITAKTLRNDIVEGYKTQR